MSRRIVCGMTLSARNRLEGKVIEIQLALCRGYAGGRFRSGTGWSVAALREFLKRGLTRPDEGSSSNCLALPSDPDALLRRIERQAQRSK